MTDSPGAGPSSRAGAGPVLAILALALTTQVLSAAFLVRDFTSPNAASVIATSIVERGEFAARAWPRVARAPDGGEAPLRAYHLPAEPVLLAMAHRLLPPALTPYIHVPITTLFVCAVATLGWLSGGRRIGFLAGVFAALDPFVLAHGPVWDDAFLAAAMEWTVFALLLRSFLQPGTGRLGFGALIAVAAGVAAITRGSSSIVLGLIALAIVTRPRFRGLRWAGWTVLAAMGLAATAWGVRNLIVVGEFHAGSSHDGITLFESNYATARPSILRTGIAESYTIEDLAPHFEAVATMTEFDANRYFTRQAIAYAWREPVDVLGTASLKFFSSVTGVNLGQPLTSARNVVALGVNLVLIVVSIFGWRVWRRGIDGASGAGLTSHIFVVVLLVTALGLLAGPVGLRYRISAAPIAYLCTAIWVGRLIPSALSRDPSTRPSAPAS